MTMATIANTPSGCRQPNRPPRTSRSNAASTAAAEIETPSATGTSNTPGFRQIDRERPAIAGDRQRAEGQHDDTGANRPGQAPRSGQRHRGDDRNEQRDRQCGEIGRTDLERREVEQAAVRDRRSAADRRSNSTTTSRSTGAFSNAPTSAPPTPQITNHPAIRHEPIASNVASAEQHRQQGGDDHDDRARRRPPARSRGRARRFAAARSSRSRCTTPSVRSVSAAAGSAASMPTARRRRWTIHGVAAYTISTVSRPPAMAPPTSGVAA